MKLTDFLQDVGRPVAYYPSLRRITGSTNATILLCQFIYWKGKESDPDGWLYKESAEIEKETGLSYEEQKGARKKLVEAGLIEEHYARLDHQMKFRLNLETIDTNWGTRKSLVPEQGNPSMGNEEIPFSLNESENTSENNTQKIIDSANKKVDAILDMANFPGAKKSARVDSILSYCAVTLRRTTTSKEWNEFAKWIDDRQQEGQKVEVFVAWLLGQKGYDPQFWPVKKMMEFWPQAFVEIPKPDDGREEGMGFYG